MNSRPRSCSSVMSPTIATAAGRVKLRSDRLLPPPNVLGSGLCPAPGEPGPGDKGQRPWLVRCCRGGIIEGVRFHRVRVVRRMPHPGRGFTQGLIADGDTIWESTGGYGESALSRYRLTEVAS